MKSIYQFLLLSFLLLLSISCANDAGFEPSGSDTGVAGSYARFLVVGDFMYIVDDSSIKTFDVSDPAFPQQVDQQTVGDRIESIFRFEDKLFIGSGAGLFIYQIMENGLPQSLSVTPYFDTFDTFACDPVVANETHAYVTLNSLSRVDRPCGGGTIEVNVNVLKVFNIEDITNPLLIQEYEMSAPKGVGLDGTTLFVCDNDQGLKIFDVSNPEDLQLIKHFDNFTTFDVIPLDGLLLVVGPDNVYQFDYSDLDNIRLVAEIPYGT